MKILSIIIPIYNVEKYLAECLDSVVDIDDIEIILVNDFTPDNSMKIAESYTTKYDNISLIHHNTNKGLGAARNTGIKNATGKYILFLDSDDFLDRNKLKSFMETLENIDYEQILVSYIRFSEEGGDWPLQYKKTYTTNNGKVLNRSNFRTLVDIINLSQLRIIKREKILSDNIWFPDGLYEDILWSYWFAYSCVSTLVINNRIYYYRQRPNSILSSTSKRHMEFFEQQKKTLELFKSKSVPSITMSIIQNKMLSHSKYILFKTKRIPEDLQEDFCEQMMSNAQSFLLAGEYEIKNKNNEIQKQNKLIKDKEKLQKSIKELISVKFISHPIQKYKQYKKLLKSYYNIK